MDATNSQQIKAFQDWLEGQGLCENTVTQRVSFAESRLRAWGTFDVPPGVVGKWLSGYTGWSRRTYHNHLRSMYRWLVSSGQLAEDPTAGVRTTTSPRPKPKPLTTNEAGRALAAAEGDLRAWLMLGMFAGLRSHEIAKMSGTDITRAGIYVLGKGGQAEIVPTHPVLWALAELYPQGGWWFPSPHRDRAHICASTVGQRVRAHFRGLGIEQGSIHRTRATFGTALLRNGENIAVVQDLMRHRSLSSTAHYLGVDDSERVTAIGRLAA